MRNGIPSSLRTKIWPNFSGARLMESKIESIHPGYYADLVRKFELQAPPKLGDAEPAVRKGKLIGVRDPKARTGVRHVTARTNTQRTALIHEQIDTDLRRTFSADRTSVNTDKGRAAMKRAGL